MKLKSVQDVGQTLSPAVDQSSDSDSERAAFTRSLRRSCVECCTSHVGCVWTSADSDVIVVLVRRRTAGVRPDTETRRRWNRSRTRSMSNHCIQRGQQRPVAPCQSAPHGRKIIRRVVTRRAGDP